MLLIIIPALITILLVWYVKKNVLFNGRKLIRIIRWLIIVISFIPVINIISLIVCMIVFIICYCVGDIEFKGTRINRFLKG